MDLRKPLAHANLPLRFPQQQSSGIGGLISTIEIDGQFLALNSWQIKGEKRIVGHRSCGAVQDAKHFVIKTDSLRESCRLRQSLQRFSHNWRIIRASPIYA